MIVDQIICTLSSSSFYDICYLTCSISTQVRSNIELLHSTKVFDNDILFCYRNAISICYCYCISTCCQTTYGVFHINSRRVIWHNTISNYIITEGYLIWCLTMYSKYYLTLLTLVTWVVYYLIVNLQ